MAHDWLMARGSTLMANGQAQRSARGPRPLEPGVTLGALEVHGSPGSPWKSWEVMDLRKTKDMIGHHIAHHGNYTYSEYTDLQFADVRGCFVGSRHFESMQGWESVC